MKEVHNHKKNMENLLTSITKFFGLDMDLISLSKLNRFFDEEDYKNLIVLSYDCLDLKLFNQFLSQNSFLVKHKFFNITIPKTSDDEVTHIDLLNRINEVDGCRAYSVMPFGVGAYSNLEEAFKRIVNLSLGDSKKLIYASFRGYYHANREEIHRIDEDCSSLCAKLDNSVILIISESAVEDIKAPLCVVKRMSSSERVRPAEPKDLDAVNSFILGLSNERMAGRGDIFEKASALTQNNFYDYCSRLRTKNCLVYEISEEVVGFILFDTCFVRNELGLKDRSYLSIESIYVKEEYRRRKIGTMLYQEACRYAAKLRVKRVEFNVYEFEESMIAFLNHLDAKVVSKLYEVYSFDVN